MKKSTNTPFLFLFIFIFIIIGCKKEDSKEDQVTTKPITTHSGAGVTDIDGNTYTTVVFGNGQEWMSENLRTSKYANGDIIPNIKDSVSLINLITDSWWHYNNNASNEIPYGKLYNWYALTDSRKICPAGWHIPSNSEWNALLAYLDPNASGIGNNVAGGKMKSTGTTYWISPNTGATNEAGFSAQPGGICEWGSDFSNIGQFGYWWSSTIYQTNSTPGTSVIWTRTLDNQSNILFHTVMIEGDALSIRCIKD